MIAPMGRQASPAALTPLLGGLQHLKPLALGEVDLPPLQTSSSNTARTILKTQPRRQTSGSPAVSLEADVPSGGTRAANDYAGVDQRGSRDDHSPLWESGNNKRSQGLHGRCK